MLNITVSSLELSIKFNDNAPPFDLEVKLKNRLLLIELSAINILPVYSMVWSSNIAPFSSDLILVKVLFFICNCLEYSGGSTYKIPPYSASR